MKKRKPLNGYVRKWPNGWFDWVVIPVPAYKFTGCETPVLWRTERAAKSALKRFLRSHGILELTEIADD